MIVGNPSIIAIESGITKAFERLSFRALGFFVIHILGRRYGVLGPEATLLACSFDEVQKRTAGRGKHIAPFAIEATSSQIADSFWETFFESNGEAGRFFGMTRYQFRKLILANDLQWAPDGDEAFDDGSYILQFDVEDRVRLIAFKSSKKSGYDPETLNDLWVSANDFYSILGAWRDAFEAEWRAAEKISIADDGGN